MAGKKQRKPPREQGPETLVREKTGRQEREIISYKSVLAQKQEVGRVKTER